MLCNFSKLSLKTLPGQPHTCMYIAFRLRVGGVTTGESVFKKKLKEVGISFL